MGKCRGAGLPKVEQAHTHVQVCLTNQTGIAGVLDADPTAVFDLTTIAKRLRLLLFNWSQLFVDHLH